MRLHFLSPSSGGSGGKQEEISKAVTYTAVIIKLDTLQFSLAKMTKTVLRSGKNSPQSLHDRYTILLKVLLESKRARASARTCSSVCV